MTVSFTVADTRDFTATLADGSVNLIVTSPPFLALRSYLPADHPDKHREIGSEANPAAFLDVLLELTAEWRRVLAPHGTLAVELGDTYSGAGGYGSPDSPNPAYGNARFKERFDGRTAKRFKKKNDGWPLAKSLACIPDLYKIALAYGVNPLTGQPSPAGRWRVRNDITWLRPNPPVGALGDKWRPASSRIIVACTGSKRWFDLDAVRSDYKKPEAIGKPIGHKKEPDYGEDVKSAWTNRPDFIIEDRGGAPPLDWHTDGDIGTGSIILATQPYSGSHYATFPMDLPRKLIACMCPREVCRECGKARERVTEATYKAHGDVDKQHQESRVLGATGTGTFTTAQGMAHGRATKKVETLGWTDCGHGSVVCSSCGVLVPYDHALRGRGQEARGQAEVGQEGVLGEPVQGASGQAEDPEGVRGLRRRVPSAVANDSGLHAELFSAPSSHGGASEPTRRSWRGKPDVEGWPQDERSGLRPGLGATGDAGTREERVHDGTSSCDAGEDRPPARSVGDRSPSQRREGRQPAGESGDRDACAARGGSDLPALPDTVQGELGGYSCPCGSTDFRYVADHYRPGIVFDPFCGSGTTLAAAQDLGRDAVGVDLDPRNADLARERVGMFLEVVA